MRTSVRYGRRRRLITSDSAQNLQDPDLMHKVAPATGSSRGIGTAVARLFAEHESEVALTRQGEAALSAVRDSIERWWHRYADYGRCDARQRGDLGTSPPSLLSDGRSASIEQGDQHEPCAETRALR